MFVRLIQDGFHLQIVVEAACHMERCLAGLHRALDACPHTFFTQTADQRPATWLKEQRTRFYHFTENALQINSSAGRAENKILSMLKKKKKLLKSAAHLRKLRVRFQYFTDDAFLHSIAQLKEIKICLFHRESCSINQHLTAKLKEKTIRCNHLKKNVVLQIQAK